MTTEKVLDAGHLVTEEGRKILYTIGRPPKEALAALERAKGRQYRAVAQWKAPDGRGVALLLEPA